MKYVWHFIIGLLIFTDDWKVNNLVFWGGLLAMYYLSWGESLLVCVAWTIYWISELRD